jgi:leucyl aminopeptidase (aminopeptidase T)
MEDRWTRLAELAAHGANVQAGQIVMVSAELGQEPIARPVAAACYERGAKFVDVVYFDPHLKRARIENADPSTLEYVPEWYAERLLTLADIACPILSVVGTIDEIAPAAGVRAIRRAAPRADVYELALPAGHFGLVVGSRANAVTWPAVAIVT